MLSLFSIKSDKHARKFSHETASVSADTGSDATAATISLSEEQPVDFWQTKRGRSRLFLGHKNDCECCLRPLPMQQSIDELEWERGIWGLSANGNYDRSY